MPRITDMQSHDGEVVRHPRGRHIHLLHIGLQGEPDGGEEYLLRRLRHIIVLLHRNTHHRGGPHSVTAVRHRRNMKERITVFEGVETGMVAEGALHRLLFGRVHVPLYYEITVGRDIEVVRHAPDQPHGPTPQESRQQILVDAVRHGRSGGVGVGRVAAEADTHGHPPSRTPIGFVMFRAGLVHVPVHPRGAAVEHLHAVHAHIDRSGRRVCRIHHGQRHEAPAVGGPALKHRKQVERRIATRADDLLTRTATAHPFREPAGRFAQQRQGPYFLDERTFGRHDFADQPLYPGRKFIQRSDAEGQRHPTVGTEEVHRHRKRRPRILEKQRPPAMFHHPVGYLRHLLHRIHACLYPYQLALPFEQVDIFPQTAVHKQNYFYFYKSNQFSRFGS